MLHIRFKISFSFISYSYKTTNQLSTSNSNLISCNQNRKLRPCTTLHSELLKDVDLLRLQKDGKPFKPHLSTLERGVNFTELASIVDRCVQFYNSKTQSSPSMFNASQFNVNEAMSFVRSFHGNNLVPISAREENSLEALSIGELRSNVIKDFSDNWEKYFIEWRRESDAKLEVIKKLAEHNIMLTHKLYEQNKTLEAHNKNLEEKEENFLF